jgi:hypothetical protein
MMLRAFCLAGALSACLVASGCSKKEPTDAGAPAAPAAPAKVSVDAPDAPPPPPPTAAPVPAAGEAPRPDGPPSEENVDELTRITRAIQSFAINNERPPKDLNELVRAKLLPSIPAAPAGKKFVYDPSHMSIKLVNQ